VSRTLHSSRSGREGGARSLVAAVRRRGLGGWCGKDLPDAEPNGGSQEHTLRVGDKPTVPAVNQRCAVYMEGGAPELYCARPRQPRHQVTIFRDRISIWKAGNPDQPAWSRKP
jgi:hypothetical protein